MNNMYLYIYYRVCKQWYSVLHDPYLYQHIVFKDLEFKSLLISMRHILSTSPQVRSLAIEGCWSQFLRDTVVPLVGCELFAPIRHLQPHRRRLEYKAQQFSLHRDFSKLLEALLPRIESLTIAHCDLDFEMTTLFASLLCHGQSLVRFRYDNNGDAGIDSPQLLLGIIRATPNMRHFSGRHAGMTDQVLNHIWPQIESLTIADGREPISRQALYDLLSESEHLRWLELDDLSCLTNTDLAMIQHTTYPLKSLRVSKYITPPLSMPGFYDLLRLFPDLERLEYVTNFNTFHHQFEGVTLDLFENERKSVANLMEQYKKNYVERWYQPMTHEQYLMASVLRLEGY